MRIYFTASVTGKKRYLNKYQQIIASLQRMGVTVIFQHLLDVSSEKVRDDSAEDRKAYFEYLNDSLSDCDGVIAETSYPSTSIGFEICYAMTKSKPVAVLYSSLEGYPPVVAGIEKDQLLMEEYQSSLDLQVVLKDVINHFSKYQNQRFTLLLPAKIKDYLDQLSEQGVNRSEFIRELIEKEMKN